jgi:hypothetical protein
VQYLGEDAIAAESGRREGVAVDDVNRMADRVASINESNLIRGGVDQSTRATAERGDITAQLATEMAKAREAARSEGIRYVAGINDQLRLDEGMDQQRRAQTLQETANVYGVPVEFLMRSPEVASALGGASFREVGSAVYDRDITSANNFRGPLDVSSSNYGMNIGSANNYDTPLAVGSANMQRGFSSANDYRLALDVGSGAYRGLEEDLGLGMSGIQGFQTGIGAQAFNNSGEFNFTLPQMTSAGSFFQNSQSGLNSVLNSRNQNYRLADQNAAGAAYGAGQAFTSFAKEAGSFFGNRAQAPASGGGRAPVSSWLRNPVPSLLSSTPRNSLLDTPVRVGL